MVELDEEGKLPVERLLASLSQVWLVRSLEREEPRKTYSVPGADDDDDMGTVYGCGCG